MSCSMIPSRASNLMLGAVFLAFAASRDPELSRSVDTMEERVAAAHAQARKSLARKKSEFEASLQAQKAVIDRLEAESGNIASDIREFGIESSALKIEAEGLMQANNILLESLVQRLSKVTLAGKYLEASVNDTADAEAGKLEELLAPPKRDLQFYVDEARNSLRSVSLIQTSSTRASESNITQSKVLLESLADTLEKVTKATADASARLKASYVAASERLAEAKANATEHQGLLMQERAKAEAYMQDMKRAVDYLQSQHLAIEQRTAGVQAFSAKLQSGVDAVLRQAHRLAQGEA